MTESGALTRGGEPAGRGGVAALLLIVVACLLVYAQTVRMDFVYDDIVALKERPADWSLKTVASAFTGSVMQGVGKQSPYYRPLQVVAMDLERAVWGQSAAGFHVTSILFHCLASILVFFLARRLLGSPPAATVAALLFALHPLQAEAVTWITARGDILCGIFMIAAFLAFARYVEEGRHVGLAWSLGLFSAALLTKEMAVTYPLLLGLYLYFRGGRAHLRPLSLHVIPLVTYFGLRLAVLPSQVWEPAPLSWRLATGFGLVARYLGNLLLPVNLRVFYDLPVQKSFISAAVLGPLALLLALLAGTVLLCRRRSLSGLGLAWFFIAILPVSGFAALLQPALMADRYAYIPSIGLAVAGGACFSFFEPRRRKEALCVAGFLCLCLAGGAILRTFAWRDQPTYMRRVIEDAPRTVFGHYYRGSLLLDEGRLDEALAAFTSSLQLNPDLAETHQSLGIIYVQKGLLDEAEKAFLTATRLDPSLWKGFTNLGVVYLQERRAGEAIAAFRRSLEINPADAFARENLNNAFALLPAGGGSR